MPPSARTAAPNSAVRRSDIMLALRTVTGGQDPTVRRSSLAQGRHGDEDVQAAIAVLWPGKGTRIGAMRTADYALAMLFTFALVVPAAAHHSLPPNSTEPSQWC